MHEIAQGRLGTFSPLAYPVFVNSNLDLHIFKTIEFPDCEEPADWLL